MAEPFISIIIATYNRASYIAKAIQSVLAQTYSHWELIIWNDGSEDDTEKVVKSFSDDRIYYYFEENHGKCFALNRAIELAKGSWIAILDDDDQWFPSKLAEQIGVINCHPQIDILFTDFNNINLVTGENGNGFEQTIKGMKKLKVEELEKKVYLIVDNYFEAVTKSNFILPSSVIFRKDISARVGKFRIDLRNGEDFEYWWRLYLFGYKFAYLKEVLVNRIKPAASLSSPSLERELNVLKSLDYCLNISQKNGREDLALVLVPSYRKAYMNIAKAYGMNGQYPMLIKSYISSLKYGFNLKELLLLGYSMMRSIW